MLDGRLEGKDLFNIVHQRFRELSTISESEIKEFILMIELILEIGISRSNWFAIGDVYEFLAKLWKQIGNYEHEKSTMILAEDNYGMRVSVDIISEKIKGKKIEEVEKQDAEEMILKLQKVGKLLEENESCTALCLKLQGDLLAHIDRTDDAIQAYRKALTKNQKISCKRKLKSLEKPQ